jgi:hypothetical protein
MRKEQHAEGIKKSFEKLMGINLSLKRKRKNENDSKREIFEKLILNLEKINIRSNILINDFDMDLNKYDEPFFEVIDSLINSLYGREAAEVIFFFIYERINPDGTINEYEITDKEGNPVVLNTSTDLWNVINYINSKK